jgi:hypothetical protein
MTRPDPSDRGALTHIGDVPTEGIYGPGGALERAPVRVLCGKRVNRRNITGAALATCPHCLKRHIEGSK